MSRLQLETNLDGLCQRLERNAWENGIALPSPLSEMAKGLSDSLYLAHSTTEERFGDICTSGYLKPGKPVSPTCAEVVMGTAGSVFFYVAPFRYPNTGCGLLFAASLESAHAYEGAATPFDSGGLASVLARQDPAEPVRGFLARHELPAPGHRRYLGMSMDALFGKPEDYVEGTEPRWPGPIGLTGGDQRRWTHEVRIPDQVFVRGSHLQAVFAPRARVAADSHIEKLFQWCVGEGVDWVVFETPSRNDFEALRNECRAYIRRTLY